MLHAEQRGHSQVPAGLLHHTVAHIHQQHHGIGGGGAGDGVAGVLHVAGAVGQHKAAPVGGEVAVGHIDGDALLALGAQAVGQQREVQRLLRQLVTVALTGGLAGVEAALGRSAGH